MAPFLDLPNELLREIFSYLDSRQLLNASLVREGARVACLRHSNSSFKICQRINKLIHGSVELRYIIELAIDGLVDCPNFSLPTAQRLETLLDRRQSWARLRWRRRVPIEISGTCSACDFVGGVFAKTASTEDGGGKPFLSTWLPSRDDRGHEVAFPDIGLRAIELAIDPSQDLVAFVVMGRAEGFV
jgi:hypothetical protein